MKIRPFVTAQRLMVCAALIGVTVVSASATSATSSPPTAADVQRKDDGPTLRDAAAAKGLLIGAAVDGYSLASNPAYADAVARNFNSVTPENAMKLLVTRPTATTWDFTEADAIVAFAQAHGIQVRGSTLIWGQPLSGGIPQWWARITNRAAFKQQFITSITGEMQHFKGLVSRWDVVNEPFQNSTGKLDNNLFMTRIGSGYIDLAFRTARAADPGAELWLNEANVEYSPAKAAALILLVAKMKKNRVPIDGVGLQTHLIGNDPPAGTIQNIVAWLHALGVKVALTELDVPTGAARPAAAGAAVYGQVVGELIAGGGSEVTVWGVSDNRSWLDYPQIRQTNRLVAAWDLPSRPLLLDTNYARKDAYNAVLAAMS